MAPAEAVNYGVLVGDLIRQWQEASGRRLSPSRRDLMFRSAKAEAEQHLARAQATLAAQRAIREIAIELFGSSDGVKR